MSEIEVVAATSGADAAERAANHIAQRVEQALARQPTFCLALSGGSTPRRMLQVLAGLALEWPRVHVFQVDERVAPAGDGARNINMVEETLLADGALQRANLHPMPVETDDLAQAARDYQRELGGIAGVPAVLDLVHLGIGDDGHTASLVPGDAVLGVDDADVAVCQAYRGHHRLTLTYPALRRAREILWLATGADKAPMLARLMAGDADIPAGRVRAANARLFTDVAIA